MTRPLSRFLTALAVVLLLLSPVAPARAATAVLPLRVTNDSGRSDVRLYLVGVDLTSGRLGYVDAAGAFRAWSLSTGGAPVAAPDISIAGPATGASRTIGLPRNVSGRLYFSFGAPLSFRLVSGGLVQPAPWNPADPNASVLFDWSEFTYAASGLWLNSSQVDQFAVPHEVIATGADGRVARTGALVPGGRQRVVAAIRALPDFARSVITARDGTVLRVLAPGKATAAGLLRSDYLDPAIQAAWSTYRSRDLVVQPFGAGPARYTGRTVGDRLVFTDPSGAQVASFARPTTQDVWDCAGALQAPNDPVVGPIARTLCAALQRGTLATQPGQPSAPGTFYRSAPANLYSKIVHANAVDGLAYGFAFDDVGDQESLVHQADPVAAGIVLEPLGTAPARPTRPVSTAPSPVLPSTPAPGPAPSGTVTTTVDLPAQPAGWATLVLGSGTAPGLVTVAVTGGSTSTVAVSGPGPVRVNLTGPAGPHPVAVSSTGTLGSVQVVLP